MLFPIICRKARSEMPASSTLSSLYCPPWTRHISSVDILRPRQDIQNPPLFERVAVKHGETLLRHSAVFNGASMSQISGSTMGSKPFAVACAYIRVRIALCRGLIPVACSHIRVNDIDSDAWGGSINSVMPRQTEGMGQASVFAFGTTAVRKATRYPRERC